MSDEIRPGDVVVCVDESPCKCCGGIDPDLCIGRMFRVVTVGRGFNTAHRVWVDTLHWPGQSDFNGHPSYAGKNIARFRKLPTADTEFTAQMRAMKPRKRRAQQAVRA
jgi:hypothetical protein